MVLFLINYVFFLTWSCRNSSPQKSKKIHCSFLFSNIQCMLEIPCTDLSYTRNQHKYFHRIFADFIFFLFLPQTTDNNTTSSLAVTINKLIYRHLHATVFFSLRNPSFFNRISWSELFLPTLHYHFSTLPHVHIDTLYFTVTHNCWTLSDEHAPCRRAVTCPSP